MTARKCRSGQVGSIGVIAPDQLIRSSDAYGLESTAGSNILSGITPILCCTIRDWVVLAVG